MYHCLLPPVYRRREYKSQIKRIFELLQFAWDPDSIARFWRDLGYAIGALSAGFIADSFGLSWAITSIAALTFLSGVVVAVAMRETVKDSRTPTPLGNNP